MVSAGVNAGKDAQDFDTVGTYQRLLAEDPDLTMPVAAIEAQIELLSQAQPSTTSEAMDLLEMSAERLKRSIRNPISLLAGTDLFRQYLLTSQQRDFKSVRHHLLTNGRLFVQRAKASRLKIADLGRHFVRDGATVLTNGGSRVVGELLKSAADASSGSVRFRVIYVLGGKEQLSDPQEGAAVVRELRQKGVPVAVIPESAVAYSMGEVNLVIVGAEGVVENGGIISRMGTYQIGLLAKASGKPFYVVAESHKFVRLYPLSQYDLPIDQKVIEFETAVEEKSALRSEDNGTELGPIGRQSLEAEWNEKTPMVQEKMEYFDSSISDETENGSRIHDAVDFTVRSSPVPRMAIPLTMPKSPDLISALITESGVLTPSAVSEELIKIWF
ncbi:MAG: translation initiation factor eIF-2B subunit alpha [Candelina mexicana]|nr:MAG: translation initiation factor eIF-2B subunit alpha [Candelina mexicana]